MLNASQIASVLFTRFEESRKNKNKNITQAKRLTVPRVVSKFTSSMRDIQIPQEQQEKEEAS